MKEELPLELIAILVKTCASTNATLPSGDGKDGGVRFLGIYLSVEEMKEIKDRGVDTR